MAYLPRMLQLYRDEIMEKLRNEFEYANVMQIPRLLKITLNMGLGEDRSECGDSRKWCRRVDEHRGSKARHHPREKIHREFKLREGMPIGAIGDASRCADVGFYGRACECGAPRVRDFRGLSPKSFDGRGNFSLGIREQLIFLKSISTRWRERVAIGGSSEHVGETRTRRAGHCFASWGVPFRVN